MLHFQQKRAAEGHPASGGASCFAANFPGNKLKEVVVASKEIISRYIAEMYFEYWKVDFSLQLTALQTGAFCECCKAKLVCGKLQVNQNVAVYQVSRTRCVYGRWNIFQVFQVIVNLASVVWETTKKFCCCCCFFVCFVFIPANVLVTGRRGTLAGL